MLSLLSTSLVHCYSECRPALNTLARHSAPPLNRSNSTLRTSWGSESIWKHVFERPNQAALHKPCLSAPAYWYAVVSREWGGGPGTEKSPHFPHRPAFGGPSLSLLGEPLIRHVSHRWQRLMRNPPTRMRGSRTSTCLLLHTKAGRRGCTSQSEERRYRRWSSILARSIVFPRPQRPD